MHWMRETTIPGFRRMETNKSESLYHEKQVKELCALHALNNLFQDNKAFSKKGLDDICTRLSSDHIFNPHRSMFGLGNYDVNVIMAALQTKDCETVWFDKRKDIDCLVFKNIKGFILNIPTEFKLGVLKLPIKRKHWIAIREIHQTYYNFDSKLPSPEVIGQEDQFKDYLRDQLQNRDAELLLVVSQDVGSVVSWRKGEINSDGETSDKNSSGLTDSITQKSNSVIENGGTDT